MKYILHQVQVLHGNVMKQHHMLVIKLHGKILMVCLILNFYMASNLYIAINIDITPDNTVSANRGAFPNLRIMPDLAADADGCGW